MVAQIDGEFLRTRPSKIWARLLAYSLFEGRPLTTSGRWINPLVFAGHRLWAALPIGRRLSAPIFILGVGRSGTTILGTILALHRDVGYLNEPKALWHAALGDDDLIGSYTKAPGGFRMRAGDARSCAVRRLQRSYSAYLWLTGNRRIVDKYPELIYRNELIDVAFPDARKILLIRNGNDICRSIANWSAKNGQLGSDWWGRDRRKWHLMVDQLVAPDADFSRALAQIRTLDRQVDMAAVEWIVTMREALRIRDDGADRFMFVRYEDLVQLPSKILSDILKFCGLAPDETMVDFGSRVLRARKDHALPEIHSAIAPLFNQTMRALGYSA